MVIDVLQKQKTLLIKYQGRLDISNRMDFESEIMELNGKQRPRPERTVLDLGELIYVDSSGIASLINIYKWLKNEKSDLLLVNLNDNLTKLLKSYHLDNFFHFTTEKELKLKFF